MYDGTVKASLGQCQLSAKNWENKVVGLEFELLKTQQHSLLSLDTCLELQLLTYEAESVCMAEANHWVTKEQIVQEYADVFTGLGCCPGKSVKNRPTTCYHN